MTARPDGKVDTAKTKAVGIARFHRGGDRLRLGCGCRHGLLRRRRRGHTYRRNRVGWAGDGGGSGLVRAEPRRNTRH
jgi:hypothetical protein